MPLHIPGTGDPGKVTWTEEEMQQVVLPALDKFQSHLQGIQAEGVNNSLSTSAMTIVSGCIALNGAGVLDQWPKLNEVIVHCIYLSCSVINCVSR